MIMKDEMQRDQIWVQQSTPNACVLNVMQMMLRQRNIECSLEDISKKCWMHAMINKEPDTYSAGFLAYQNARCYNQYLHQFHLEWVDGNEDHIGTYLEKIETALHQTGSVLISILSKNLPYGAHLQHSARHAIMLYAIDENGYHFLDSDGGLARDQKYQYFDVKDQVDYVFTKEDFTKKMMNDRQELRYAFIKDTTELSEQYQPVEMIKTSISTMKDFSSVANQRLEDMSHSAELNYHEFYSLTYQMIRPMVNDFAVALSFYDKKHSLLEYLSGWKTLSFQQMSQIKNGDYDKMEIINTQKDRFLTAEDEILAYLEGLLEKEMSKNE